MNEVTHSRSLPSRRQLAVCLAATLGLNVPCQGVAPARSATAITTPAHLARQPSSRDTALERREAPNGDVVVTNCNDNGPGSLRDAVAGAADDVDIDLSSLTCSTITLTSGAIAIAQDTLVLIGPGATALTIDGNNGDRIFDHTGSGYLDIDNLALAHGAGVGNGGCIRSNGGIGLVSSSVYACHAYASGEARGGAIYAYAVALEYTIVATSEVESDTAYARGGGVFAYRLQPFFSTISSNIAFSHASRSFGGGAYVTLDLNMRNSTISGNQASIAGGIGVHSAGLGNAYVVDSTVSGNLATLFMGGMFTDSPLQMYNSTIAFNCAAGTVVNPNYIAGIGLHFRASAPNLYSSIIADNTLCNGLAADAPQDLPYDISGNLFNGSIGGGHNLIVTAAVAIPADTLRSDPLLGPLRENGGPTPTHALLPGSPAIDAGSNVTNRDTDQRGPGYGASSARPRISARSRPRTRSSSTASSFPACSPLHRHHNPESEPKVSHKLEVPSAGACSIAPRKLP